MASRTSGFGHASASATVCRSGSRLNVVRSVQLRRSTRGFSSSHSTRGRRRFAIVARGQSVRIASARANEVASRFTLRLPAALSATRPISIGRRREPAGRAGRRLGIPLGELPVALVDDLRRGFLEVGANGPNLHTVRFRLT